MKKVFICWMFFLLMFSSTAFASESEKVDEQGAKQIVNDTEVVEPRYTYIGYMTIVLDIDENGYLSYSGSARAPYRNIRITLTLQCSANGLFWDDLEAVVKNGYDSLAAGSSRTVPEDDYFYRAKIVTDVYDSNHNIIETATGYSSEERY